MLRRLMPLALLTPFLALSAAAPAHADAVPNQGDHWPMCHTGTDTDGKYCISSILANGSPASLPDYNAPGSYPNPFVNFIGAGDVLIGLDTVVVHPDLTVDEVENVDPTTTWVYTVNTGSVRPNEMYGHVSDVDMSIGGNATTGYTFTLTFKPTPIAWVTPLSACSYDGGCGDDTTTADFVLNGFVTGVVTDDANSGLPAAEIADRHGYVQGTNAEDSYPFYDPDTNTLEIRMANPHLKPPGVATTGFYDTFLPNAYLINDLKVPDPKALSDTNVSIVRAGSTDPVSFTLTHQPGGVRIHIANISFSTPKYRIHPKPTPPGSPRWGSVKRTSKHSVRVTFKAPLANGGKPVTAYRARCHAGTGAWHTVKRGSSPITVSSLPRRGVSCEVAAHNSLGWGAWSRARKEG